MNIYKNIKFILSLFLILQVFQFNILAANQNPNSAHGKIIHIQSFHSKYIAERNIDIWLPEDYSANNKYGVLYMQDGQMLYDSAMTWNKQAWDIDDVLSSMSKLINECIVVGIWNGNISRHSEYFPERVYKNLTSSEKDTISARLKIAGRVKDTFNPISDNYLKFIVKELKPYIDKNYSVYTDLTHTYIGGSSMGALISIYAICEYPKVFGAAMCISTHWPGIFTLTNNPFPNAMIRYLDKNLPSASQHKLYFDCGDQTLDALYPNIQKEVNIILKQHSYSNEHLKVEFFPGENHTEQAWKKRLHIPLMFLLKK